MTLVMDPFDPLVSLPLASVGDAPADMNPLASPPLDQPGFDIDPFPRPVSLPTHPNNPLKRNFNSYEENYSDVLSSCDQTSFIDSVPTENVLSDRDSKLLHFSQPSYRYALLDYTYRRISLSITSQLNGMFFLAEPVLSANGDLVSSPQRLTCYRRNLFSISGSLSIPRGLRYILTETSEQIPIVATSIELSAFESIEGSPVKIISVPWKTPVGTAPVPDEKPEKEPPPIPLDLVSGAEYDPEYATIPITWKRLQFRVATANNGRRKELQQHFVITLQIVATLSTGQKVPLCETTSGSIVVRGRSPRNFQSKNEVPVGNTNTGNRRHSIYKSPPGTSAKAPPPLKSEPGGVNVDMSQFPVPDFLDWGFPNAQASAMTAVPADNVSMPPPAVPYAHSSPDATRQTNARPPLAPITLSLDENETQKKSESLSPPSAKKQRLAKPPARAPSFSLKDFSENDDSADLFYEYFPLGMDDWQEPVDAVYRPHVVHHINIPDQKNKAQGNRSKRYFSSKNSSP